MGGGWANQITGQWEVNDINPMNVGGHQRSPEDEKGKRNSQSEATRIQEREGYQCLLKNQAILPSKNNKNQISSTSKLVKRLEGEGR